MDAVLLLLILTSFLLSWGVRKLNRKLQDIETALDNITREALNK